MVIENVSLTGIVTFGDSTILFATIVTSLRRSARNRSFDVFIALLLMKRTMVNIWFWHIYLVLHVFFPDFRGYYHHFGLRHDFLTRGAQFSHQFSGFDLSSAVHW